MYNGGQLRDSYNREIIPNKMQPSQHSFSNSQSYSTPTQSQCGGGSAGQSYNFQSSCSGPPAFDSGLGLGGVNSFGAYADFSSMNNGPVYNNTGPAISQATAPACSPCSGKLHTADPYGQQQAPMNQYIGHQQYNQQDQQYGGGSGRPYSSIEQQNQMQQLIQQTSSSEEMNNGQQTCSGKAENFMSFNENQNTNQYVQNDNPNGQTDHVDNRTNQLTATHESVNEMLVSYLKATIKYIAQQLKIKPDWIDLSPDGGASWKYSSIVQGNSIWSRVFTKIELHGERKAYKYPLPYIGNVTTTTRIKLDCEILNDLLREFPMMSYCQATKNLQITMDSLEHNLAILALICACQKEKISINRIKYHELVKKYMLLTTPGHKNYNAGAKYSLIRQIRK